MTCLFGHAVISKGKNYMLITTGAERCSYQVLLDLVLQDELLFPRSKMAKFRGVGTPLCKL